MDIVGSGLVMRLRCSVFISRPSMRSLLATTHLSKSRDGRLRTLTWPSALTTITGLS